MDLFEIKEAVEEAIKAIDRNPEKWWEAEDILDTLQAELWDELIAEGICPKCGGEIRFKVLHYTDQDGKPDPDEYIQVCNDCGYEIE